MRMRPVLLVTVLALLATSACGSSGGHKAPAPAAAKAAQSSPATAGAAVSKADIPGFSGPVEAPRGGVTHVFGRCLQSWYTKGAAGTRVHVGYPGPAKIAVDLTMTDESEPSPEAHKQFVMAGGAKAHEVSFPPIPRSGFPQITVESGGQSKTCDAPKH
jgi:hypothetical protein